MAGELLKFGLTTMTTLLVVVDPLGVLPIYISLTGGASARARRTILIRAVGIAFAVTIFFLLVGRALLAFLGVSVHAFAISGGVLLFLTAIPMLFGHRGGLQSPERDEHGTEGEDIAIFPLAIPLLSGPGTIATSLLLTTRARENPLQVVVLVLAAALVYLVSFAILRAGDWLLNRLGVGKVHIITRVMGIVLAALATQYVLDGIADYHAALTGR